MSKDHPNHSFARQEIRENWGRFSLALALTFEAGKKAETAAKMEIAALPGWQELPQKCLDEYVGARREEAKQAKFREICALVHVPPFEKLCAYIDLAQERHSTEGMVQLGYYQEGVITEFELALWCHQEFHKNLEAQRYKNI